MSDHDLQLTALGDPTRRAILTRLLEKPMAVGALARDFPVSRPAISQHLRLLKDAELVRDRAVGTRRIYEINPDGIDSLRRYFDRVWTDAVAAAKTQAEERPAKHARRGLPPDWESNPARPRREPRVD